MRSANPSTTVMQIIRSIQYISSSSVKLIYLMPSKKSSNPVVHWVASPKARTIPCINSTVSLITN